jgi:hypothetical protein
MYLGIRGSVGPHPYTITGSVRTAFSCERAPPGPARFPPLPCAATGPLAVLYAACRQPVPHPDDFGLAPPQPGADLLGLSGSCLGAAQPLLAPLPPRQQQAPGAPAAAAAGGGEAEAAYGGGMYMYSARSGLPPRGDLFMDLGSPGGP